MLRKILSMVGMLVLLMVHAPPVAGQQRLDLREKKSKGQVVQVAGGIVQLKDEHSGELWMVKPGRPSNVSFVGTAEVGWLRPGMIARFEGSFDNKGMGQSPIKTIQVFTPRPEYQVGVFGGDPTARNSDEPQQLMVAGAIRKISENSLTITTGKKSRKVFSAEIDPQAVVEVDLLGDLTWVQPGDLMSYEGNYYRKGQILCKEIEVTSKSILKAPPMNSQRKRRSRRKSPSPPIETPSENPKPLPSDRDSPVAKSAANPAENR